MKTPPDAQYERLGRLWLIIAVIAGQASSGAYDDQNGADYNDSPSTALGDGSIVVQN